MYFNYNHKIVISVSLFPLPSIEEVKERVWGNPGPSNIADLPNTGGGGERLETPCTSIQPDLTEDVAVKDWYKRQSRLELFDLFMVDGYFLPDTASSADSISSTTHSAGTLYHHASS